MDVLMGLEVAICMLADMGRTTEYFLVHGAARLRNRELMQMLVILLFDHDRRGSRRIIRYSSAPALARRAMPHVHIATAVCRSSAAASSSLRRLLRLLVRARLEVICRRGAVLDILQHLQGLLDHVLVLDGRLDGAGSLMYVRTSRDLLLLILLLLLRAMLNFLPA